MVNYNIDAASSGFDQFKRRSTNREVDPVSRSRINKSPLDDKTSSGFDQFNRRKTNQGLGSPTNQTNMKDDDDDKDVGGIGRLFAKFFGAAEENGLEFTTPDKKPKPSIYEKDEMKSFSYDPITRTSSIKGYPSDSDIRSSDEIMGSIDEMLSGENDPEYNYFSGSTYDEVRGPERNIVDAINMAIDKTSATGDYLVRKGDTLSEIAEAAGTTVRQLQLLNNIPDPRKMQAGSKLRVPATTSQDKEIIESATKMSDLRPLRFANQSMMTGDQRTYFPEDTAGLNNPQTQEAMLDDPATRGFGGMGPDPSVGQGLMSPSSNLDNNPQTREGLTFISTPAIDNIYEEIGAAETTTAHLGETDFEDVGITLGYGIVPTSGLKYEHNGTVIELPDNEAERWNTLSAAGVTEDNFRSSNVITDDVVKDGVRRDRYDSDESFTKAVMASFQNRVESAAERQGVEADDIPEDAMTGLVSYSYNTGESHNYNDMEPVYEELTRGANANMTTVQDGMLQVFTTGGVVIQGLANRRSADYNHVAEALSKPTITHKTNRRLANGNSGFEFEFSDGTTRTFDSGKRYDTETSQEDFKDDLNVRQAVN